MIRVLDGQDDNPFLTLQDIGIWNVVGRKLGFPKYLHLYPKNIRILVESVGDKWVLTLSPGETPGGCFYPGIGQGNKKSIRRFCWILFFRHLIE
jgi:hypothetical protein